MKLNLAMPERLFRFCLLGLAVTLIALPLIHQELGSGEDFPLFRLIGLTRSLSFVLGIVAGAIWLFALWMAAARSGQDIKKAVPSNIKRPILTLSLFLLLVFVIGLAVTDVIIGALSSDPGQTMAGRYIRLREYPVSSTYTRKPRPSMATRPGLKPEYSIRTDANGFIEPVRLHDRPDIVIAFLGGSTTENLYLDELDRFPYLAAKKLHEKTGVKVNVLNAAQSANTSIHNLNILLNKVAPAKPDIIVFMEAINDLSMLLHEGSYWPIAHSRSPIIEIEAKNIAGRSLIHAAADWFKHPFPNLRVLLQKPLKTGEGDEFAATRLTPRLLDEDAMIAAFKGNLRLFVHMARDLGFQPVLMTQPNMFGPLASQEVRSAYDRMSVSGINFDRYSELYAAFNESIRQVGDELIVDIIDLDREMGKLQSDYFDLVHFETSGSHRAAEIISRHLEKQVMLIKKRNG
ncbi:MAG: SGNH/GDSL hydrolase family protein [Alphaproteobacteria bacterium]|nr:SGNH/GDSL hydrolase family protein [Alphaproteobacteria bacterium]